MSQEHILQSITRQAAADLRNYKDYALRLVADGKVNISNTQGAYCPGILDNKPNTDEAATMAISGTKKIIASGVITEGGEVTVGTAGKIEAAASGDYVLGHALEAAAADGDKIEVLLDGGYFKS